MRKSKKNTLAKSKSKNKKRINGGKDKRASLRRRPMNQYAQQRPQQRPKKNQQYDQYNGQYQPPYNGQYQQQYPQYNGPNGPPVQRIEIDQPPLGKLKDAPANIVNAAGIGLGGVFGANVGQAAFDGLFGE
jgi:hypothetical protein